MLHPRVIRDLCRSPMWLVDGIDVSDDGRVVVRGWALPDSGDMTIGMITLNGRPPDEFARIQNQGLANSFPWHDNADWAGFHAAFHGVDITADTLKFSYVGRWTRIPFNRWQDIYFPMRVWRSRAFIEPTAPQMIRTQGSSSVFSYVTYGATGAYMLQELTKTFFGKTLADFPRICDWGSGCARVVQGVHRLAPGSSITGLDIDQDNIEWSQRSVPFATFHQVPLSPPTNIPEQTFDLLYGFSVFTHLTKDAFEAWRDEIHRMMKPGGVVLVTINRGGSMAQTTDADLIMRTLETGFDDSRGDHALDGKISDETFYRGTFLTADLAMRIFSTRFRVREIVAQAGGGGQDMVVCERV